MKLIDLYTEVTLESVHELGKLPVYKIELKK